MIYITRKNTFRDLFYNENHYPVFEKKSGVKQRYTAQFTENNIWIEREKLKLPEIEFISKKKK